MALRMLRPAFTSRVLRFPQLFTCSSIAQARNPGCVLPIQVHGASTFSSKTSTAVPRPALSIPSQLLTSRSTRTYANSSTPPGTTIESAAGAPGDTAKPATVQAPEHLDEKELHIFEKLLEAFSPVKLEVQDISGGCGSMYGIEIVSERFRGLSMLKQQRLVNMVLGDEIKSWHGIQLKTRVP